MSYDHIDNWKHSFRAKCLMLDFCEIIRELMVEHKTDPDALASALDISVKELDKIFGGKKSPPLYILAKMEDYFNIRFTIDYYSNE